MAHEIQLIVGTPSALAPLGERVAPRQLVVLSPTLSGAPVDDAFLDETFDGELGAVVDGFTYLGERLDALLRELSGSSEVVYLETEYWGGTGGQRAAAYQAGERVLLAVESDAGAGNSDMRPINRALAMLGVRGSGAGDAFDALGLGRFRGMDDFDLG